MLFLKEILNNKNHTIMKSTIDTIRLALRSNQLDSAREKLSAVDVEQAREIIETLPATSAVLAFRLLSKDTAQAAFERLSFDSQRQLLELMQDTEAVALLEALEPDESAQLLEEMPATVVQRLVGMFSDQNRKTINALLAYPEGSVGRLMNPHAFTVENQLTAAEAAEKLRLSDFDPEELDVIFVTDAAGAFHGYVLVAELLKANPTTTMNSLAERGGTIVRTTDAELQAVRIIRRAGLPKLAVLDQDNHLVGAISLDDLAEVAEREASETMYQKAGLRDIAKRKDHVFSKKLTQGGIWYPVRVRVVFLFVTLVGGLLVGGLIDAFEETLAAVLAAAVFIPLVMDMGGNVGTQSTTIFARGFALGHIQLSEFWRYFLREGLIGLTMGVFLGSVAGVVAYFWQGAPNDIPQLGIAVGVALTTVITLAAMLGFLLPYLMVKMGLDHAPGADPFITTIKDFTGLALYFWLVALLIGVPEEKEEEMASLSQPAAIVQVASAVE